MKAGESLQVQHSLWSPACHSHRHDEPFCVQKHPRSPTNTQGVLPRQRKGGSSPALRRRLPSAGSDEGKSSQGGFSCVFFGGSCWWWTVLTQDLHGTQGGLKETTQK